MRIVIADDVMVVRAGMTALLADLGHEVVGECASADAVPALVAATDPDLLVVDIRMPPHAGEDGLRAVEAVRATRPEQAVLVFSSYLVPGFLTWLFRTAPAGTGYLLKEHLLDAGALQDALITLAGGGCLVDRELTSTLLARRGGSPLAPLTDREREILALMAQGRSDRGIAEDLTISLNTVATHVGRVFRKLGLPEGPADNRRVHAVLRWLEATSAPTSR